MALLPLTTTAIFPFNSGTVSGSSHCLTLPSSALQAVWLDHDLPVVDPISHIPLHVIARALPIYPLHGTFAEPPPPSRHPLSSTTLLPPPNLPATFLPATFAVRNGSVETSVLEIAFNVSAATLSTTFLEHVLPRVSTFPAHAQLAAAQSLLLNFATLSKENPGFGSAVRHVSFVPDVTGALRKAPELHDPRMPGLEGVL